MVIVKDENNYTVYSKGKGGVIVSDTDKETAKNKFSEAMMMYESILKLEKFRNYE